ncbi:MAG: hypothetical protein AAB579_02875 [Patescibacteria group bacterium]
MTAEFWGLDKSAVSSFFPHDPSVPTNSIATIMVELLFDTPERTNERRREYAEKLGLAVEGFLNHRRHTTDARVEVAVKRFNPERDGFYMTGREPSEQ